MLLFDAACGIDGGAIVEVDGDGITGAGGAGGAVFTGFAIPGGGTGVVAGWVTASTGGAAEVGAGDTGATFSITIEFGLVGGFLETSGGFTVVCFTMIPDGWRSPAARSAGGLYTGAELLLWALSLSDQSSSESLVFFFFVTFLLSFIALAL